MEANISKNSKKKKISYAKWGYIFIASFFIVYFLFTFVPQIITIIDSFKTFVPKPNESILDFNPHYCGFDNYAAIFSVNENGYIEIFKTISIKIYRERLVSINFLLFAISNGKIKNIVRKCYI